MTDQPNGETDNPEGNKTVANSQNVDGGRDMKEKADRPNMTGATAPQNGQGDEESDEQSKDQDT